MRYFRTIDELIKQGSLDEIKKATATLGIAVNSNGVSLTAAKRTAVLSGVVSRLSELPQLNTSRSEMQYVICEFIALQVFLVIFRSVVIIYVAMNHGFK